MMQSLSGTTSMAPSTSFHLAGPSSLSQSLPAFFAQASRFLPSNRTTASLGGTAPSVGDCFTSLGIDSGFAGMKFTGFSVFRAGGATGGASAAKRIGEQRETVRTVLRMAIDFINHSGKGLSLV